MGRNESDNNLLTIRKQKTDYIFEVPDFGSPTTLLQGVKRRDAIEIAARLTARYSDCDKRDILVRYGKNKPVKSIVVEPFTQEEINESDQLINLLLVNKRKAKEIAREILESWLEG